MKVIVVDDLVEAKDRAFKIWRSAVQFIAGTRSDVEKLWDSYFPNGLKYLSHMLEHGAKMAYVHHEGHKIKGRALDKRDFCQKLAKMCSVRSCLPAVTRDFLHLRFFAVTVNDLTCV